MRIDYTDHLKLRLKVREIPEWMPAKIYRQSEERYYDHSTGHHIAVLSLQYHGRVRPVMIAYDAFEDRVQIVTIRPIARADIEKRVNTGRWTRE